MIYEETKELVIRDLELADAEAITQGEIAQGWIHATTEKHIERMKLRDQGRCIMLVACYHGEPVGYLSLYQTALAGPFKDKNVPELVDFGVLEKVRGRGIGTKLMETAERLAAQSAGEVCLGVGLHEGYGAAQRLYVKRGYVPDGSGVWYQDKIAVPYSSVENDDDLVLYFFKKLH